MQRYRNEYIGIREECRPGAAHPFAKGGRSMQAVAMLEGKHEPPASLVVAQRRARAIIGGPRSGAAAAERLAPEIVGEGKAAAGAAGLPEEGELPPARRAERRCGRDLLAASEAARREQQVEERLGRAPRRRDGQGEGGHG